MLRTSTKILMMLYSILFIAAFGIFLDTLMEIFNVDRENPITAIPLVIVFCIPACLPMALTLWIRHRKDKKPILPQVKRVLPEITAAPIAFIVVTFAWKGMKIFFPESDIKYGGIYLIAFLALGTLLVKPLRKMLKVNPI